MFFFFFYSLPSFLSVNMRFVKLNVTEWFEQVIQTDFALAFAFEFTDKALFTKSFLLFDFTSISFSLMICFCGAKINTKTIFYKIIMG